MYPLAVIFVQGLIERISNRAAFEPVTNYSHPRFRMLGEPLLEDANISPSSGEIPLGDGNVFGSTSKMLLAVPSPSIVAAFR